MEPDLNALINTSYEARPSEFQAITNELLGQRVVAALDRRRQELAQTMFASREEVPDEIELSDNDSDENEHQINSAETDSVDTGTEEPNGQDA